MVEGTPADTQQIDTGAQQQQDDFQDIVDGKQSPMTPSRVFHRHCLLLREMTDVTIV